MTLPYKQLIQDKKVLEIVEKLRQKEFSIAEKLVRELQNFEDVDNEFNRMTGRFQTKGYLYASALLFFVAEQGWTEAVEFLTRLNISIKDIVLMDSDCLPSKICDSIRLTLGCALV